MCIFTLIKKDIKIVFSDKKALIILILMPIILFVILSSALASAFGNNNELFDINIAIVKLYDIDEDSKMIAEIFNDPDIVKSISENNMENILLDILNSDELSFIDYEIMSLEKARQELDDNKLSSIVILPEHYIYDLFLNMSPIFSHPIDIKIIKNPDKQYSSSIVENIITEIANRQSQIMIINKVTNEILKSYNLNNDIITKAISDIMIDIENNEELKIYINDYKIDKLKLVNSEQYYSVAMMTMFLLFGAGYGAKFMLSEKRNFTLQRQQVTEISIIKIILGKVAIIYLIAVMQITIIIITSSLIFKVYWGDLTDVVLLTMLVSFGVMGLGSLLAAISYKIGSYRVINILESVIFQLAALFGGSYFPIFSMPKWFQNISRVIINGAALNSYLKIMMNSKFSEIYVSLIAIFLNGLIFLVIGIIIITINPKDKFMLSKKKEVI